MLAAYSCSTLFCSVPFLASSQEATGSNIRVRRCVSFPAKQLVILGCLPRSQGIPASRFTSCSELQGQTEATRTSPKVSSLIAQLLGSLSRWWTPFGWCPRQAGRKPTVSGTTVLRNAMKVVRLSQHGFQPSGFFAKSSNEVPFGFPSGQGEKGSLKFPEGAISTLWIGPERGNPVRVMGLK